MREIAKVIKVETHTVWAERQASGYCNSCALKEICNSKPVKVRILNPKGYDVDVNDFVEYEAPEKKSTTLLSGLMYGIPVVILLTLTMLLKYLFNFNDYVSLGISGIAIGVYYYLLNVYSKKHFEKFVPYIVRKVNKPTLNISSIKSQER